MPLPTRCELKKVGWSSILIVVVQLAVGVTAEAQQPGKVPRIGFVSARADPTPTTPDSSADALRQGLRNLGYIEGKNLVIEYRYFEGKVDRIPSLVAELLQLKLDVLVSVNTLTIRAFKQATKTLPIVIVINDDPVTTGIVNSLARPGGNVTGLTRLTRELSGKRLELLKEAVPKLSRVGVLDDASTDIQASFQDFDTAARALKIQLQSLEVRGPNPDLEGAFQAAASGRVNALVTVRTALLINYRKQIADLAIKNRLPSIQEGSDFVEAGGLMSYSANDTEVFRRAAYYVDRILKGTKPADLPVEQPTKFEFVINLKTAKQIGVTIPQSVLYRADRVIK
jgi:putative tryptophan/tyrosine transport system substrate-binding protein